MGAQGNGQGRTITVRRARRLDRRIAAVETANIKALKGGIKVGIWKRPPGEAGCEEKRAEREALVNETVALVAVRFALRERIGEATRAAFEDGTSGLAEIARERRTIEILEAALTESNDALEDPEEIESRMEAARASAANESGFHRFDTTHVSVAWDVDGAGETLKRRKIEAEDRIEEIEAALAGVGIRANIALSSEEARIIEAAGLTI